MLQPTRPRRAALRSASAAPLLALLVSAGCASVDYRKVPSPTQYSSWGDAQQRAADAMEGVRYYLPRPFLHLKQTIPVAQRTAIVSFVYDEQARAYRPSLPPSDPEWLRRALPAELTIMEALRLSMAATPPPTRSEQQSGGVDGEDTEPDKPPSEVRVRAGFISPTDVVTRLSALMDIVYLPDFEEQYVIQTDSGMGKEDFEVQLRNGWALETFSHQIDNSNVIPYAIDQVEAASAAAANIATTWAPVAAGLPPGVVPGSQLQSGGMDAAGDQMSADRAAAMLGEILWFKVAEVKFAQPGLYPILKPQEVEHWMRYRAVVESDPASDLNAVIRDAVTVENGRVTGVDSDAVLNAIGRQSHGSWRDEGDAQRAFELFLRDRELPWLRPDMAFVPCPPITMIGFNTTTDIFISSVTERLVPQLTGDASTNGGESTSGSAADIRATAVEIVRKLNESADVGPSGLAGAVAVGSQSQPAWIAMSASPSLIRITLSFDSVDSARAARDAVAAVLLNRESMPVGVESRELSLVAAGSMLDFRCTPDDAAALADSDDWP